MFLNDKDEDFILYKRSKKIENFLSEYQRKIHKIKVSSLIEEKIQRSPYFSLSEERKTC